jgi:hypothetical protein
MVLAVVILAVSPGFTADQEDVDLRRSFDGLVEILDKSGKWPTSGNQAAKESAKYLSIQNKYKESLTYLPSDDDAPGRSAPLLSLDREGRLYLCFGDGYVQKYEDKSKIDKIRELIKSAKGESGIYQYKVFDSNQTLFRP